MEKRHWVIFNMLCLIWVVFPGTTVFGFDDALSPFSCRIISGSGHIFNEGSTLTIMQESKTLMIEWEEFNIDNDSQVVFVQPPGSLGVLNRISDSVPSRISGKIHANGRVVLVHPAGFEFTESARVIAGDITISTREISEAEFLSGCVIDEGKPWFQDPADPPSGRILNTGLIQADSGTVDLFAGFDVEIQNTGVIRARTTASGSGRIRLISDRSSGRVEVAGTLDASAPDGGSGGFIETSAADVVIRPDAVITTWAENGACGQWLLDPKDFVVASENGDVTGDQVTRFLQNSHLEIQSAWGATEGGGDIYINDHITWVANTLTLSAHRNIVINRELYGSGTAALILQYGQGAPDGIIDGTEAEYHVNAPVNLPKGQNFRTRKGSAGTEKIFTVITELGAEGSRTGQDLQGILGNLDHHYALGLDIDASATTSWGNGTGFEPMGGPLPEKPPFSGDFDGLGHTISSLLISGNYRWMGLFGFARNCDIRNVQLKNGMIKGGNNTLGATGSLAGVFEISSLTNCGNTNRVQGSCFLGGLIGWATNSKISKVYNEGQVYGAANFIGGIVGVFDGGVISDSLNIASVTGNSTGVGGIVGQTNRFMLNNCYHSGKLISVENYPVGGLIGGNRGPVQIVSSFWDTETSGATSSAGGGTGLPTSQMALTDTYRDVGWDITTTPLSHPIWRIYHNKTYPLLRAFLTPVVLSSPGIKTYDGTTSVYPTSFSWCYPPGHIFHPERIYCDSVQTSGKDVGEYSISPKDFYSDQQGYDIGYNGDTTYYITPAPLTITAQDHTKSYDGIPYQGGNGVNGTGFVNNESLDVLSGTLSYGGTSQGATQPGTYTIIPTGLTSTNYTITFQPGTLTIGPPPPEFTVLLSAEPLEGGTVFGGGKFVYNDTVTVTAIPNPGYNFVHWTENGSPVSTSTSYSFAVTSDRTLAGHFDMVPPSKPVIDRLSPSETTAGGKAISLNVLGKYFVASSQVCWNGSKRQTTVVSAGALTADIAEIDIQDPGTASITVVNRSSDNREILSDPFPFEIRPNPQPTVETIPTLGEWGAILLVFGSVLTAVECLKSTI